MNSSNITGRIGNISLKKASNGEPHLRLSVAVNETWTDKNGVCQERTDWFQVTTWGKRAEALAKHVTKGMQCGVSGRMVSREVTDNEGNKRTLWELRMERFDFLDPKRKDGGGPTSNAPKSEGDHNADEDIPVNWSGSDDDIPF